MWKRYNKLFFIGPQSLGDFIVLNGILHHYRERCQELHVPINPACAQSQKDLIKDWKNLILVELHSLQEEDEYCAKHNLSKILRPPIFAAHDNAGVYVPPLWDWQLYTYFEIPYEKRYSGFRFPKSSLHSATNLYNHLNRDKEDYILVHKGSGIGKINYHIDTKYKIIDITEAPSPSICDYYYLIVGAKEIHCLVSAFYHLVDSLSEATNAKLFVHDLRANSRMMSHYNEWNKFRWTIVNYKEKF